MATEPGPGDGGKDAKPARFRIDVRLALVILLMVLSTASVIGQHKAEIRGALIRAVAWLHDRGPQSPRRGTPSFRSY